MVGTRATNANTHPGAVVLAQTQHRRSSQEVAATRQEEELARQKFAAAKAKKVESIATLQEKQRLVDARGSQLPKSTRATGKVDVHVAGTLFSSWHVCV